jgi:predicted CXXCH cytochrome family protein
MNKRLLILIFVLLMTLTIYRGFATTYPSYDTEQDCRNCHGNDTSDTHHLLAAKGYFNCTYCHQILYDNITQQYYPQVIRDCLVCHPGENHNDCIRCHGTNYTGASPSVTRTFVNISAFNESIHQEINATPPATLNNPDCWICHYNKDMNRQNVMKCGNCHRKPSQWHGNANITTNLSELW